MSVSQNNMWVIWSYGTLLAHHRRIGWVWFDLTGKFKCRKRFLENLRFCGVMSYFGVRFIVTGWNVRPPSLGNFVASVWWTREGSLQINIVCINELGLQGAVQLLCNGSLCPRPLSESGLRSRLRPGGSRSVHQRHPQERWVGLRKLPENTDVFVSPVCLWVFSSTVSCFCDEVWNRKWSADSDGPGVLQVSVWSVTQEVWTLWPVLRPYRKSLRRPAWTSRSPWWPGMTSCPM